MHQARAFADEKEAQEQVEHDCIETNKANALANRLRKKEEAAA